MKIDGNLFYIYIGLVILVLTSLFLMIPRLTRVNKADLISPSEGNPIVRILEEFYQLRNNQAKLSFNFSIISASLGFLLILFSLLNFLINDEANFNLEKGYLSLVSGVIIEAVAALFFRTHIRADREIQRNIDGLRIHALLHEYRDEKEKDLTRKLIIENLLLKSLDGKEIARKAEAEKN